MFLFKFFYNNYIIETIFFFRTITLNIRANKFNVVDVEHNIE